MKITDTAEVVKRVRDEVAAGKTDGSVDLVWINGENFRAMKQDKLLFGPWSESLPNYALVDVDGKPTTKQDFSESVDGLEAPWGMAQLTFFADGAKVPTPPRSMQDLTAFAAANPGRVTYSAPPDFYGTTFLKQVLYESVINPAVFAKPGDAQTFSSYEPVLTTALDAMHQALLARGQAVPQGAS